MPSAVSMYFREAILRRVFRQEPMTSVAYIALCRVVPPANADGSILDEPPSNFAYSRKRYDLIAANWEMAGNSEVASTQDIAYGTPTGNWGLIQGWALTTAATGGEIIASGSLVTPQRLDFGSEVSVQAGAISFNLGDADA